MDGQPTANSQRPHLCVLFRSWAESGGLFCLAAGDLFAQTAKKTGAGGADTCPLGVRWHVALSTHPLFRFSPKHSQLKAASTANYDPHVFAKTNTHGLGVWKTLAEQGWRENSGKQGGGN